MVKRGKAPGASLNLLEMGDIAINSKLIDLTLPLKPQRIQLLTSGNSEHNLIDTPPPKDDPFLMEAELIAAFSSVAAEDQENVLSRLQALLWILKESKNKTHWMWRD